MNFIADFEGFREKSYFDSKQWSIGYGTKSYPGEVITEQEARNRKIEYLEPLFGLVDKECYNDNQKIAMVSYMYNVGRNAMNYDNYVQMCDHNSLSYIMNVYGWSINGVYSKGLAKRRYIEINKFNN